MHRIHRSTYPEDPATVILPRDYFDLIGGTDTGGLDAYFCFSHGMNLFYHRLITLLLVKCRMSVDEALDAFYDICETVYVDTTIDAAERSGRLRRCLENILKNKGLPVDLTLGGMIELQRRRNVLGISPFTLGHFAHFPNYYPGFVVATSKKALDQFILRTYPIRAYSSVNITFVDAVLATCASQPSFLAVTTGPCLRQQTYISGNISGVNPSKQLLSEAHALFGGARRLSSFLHCILMGPRRKRNS
jgi:hypothetical protein